MADTREATLAKHQIIADVYGRAYAAALTRHIATPDLEAEAKRAVAGFIKMMQKLEGAEWGWYQTDDL